MTGFVVEGGRTLLHWHRKIGLWLPPGGHVDADEDPVQAVLREVLEETGIVGEVVGGERYAFDNVAQLPSPISIIVADVPAWEGEAAHQHIDMSYVVRPVAGSERVAPEMDHGFVWVAEARLRSGEALATVVGDVAEPPADDVREVGLRAIAIARTAERRRG